MFSPQTLSPRGKDTGLDLSKVSGLDDMDISGADSISDTGTATMVTQKQLKADISFISKNEFENLERCLICNIPFETFGSVSQHHCRACGASVCGPCSRRQINDNRVCDLCFLRVFLKKTEVRRKEQLEAKKANITQLKVSQQKLRDDILEINRQTEDLEAKEKKEKSDTEKKIQRKRQELSEMDTDLEMHENMLDQAEKQLKIEKQKQLEKEKEQATYEVQLKGITADLEQKRKVLAQKQQQVENLMEQKNKLTQTKSFLNYQTKHNAYSESDDENEEDPTENNNDINNIQDKSNKKTPPISTKINNKNEKQEKQPDTIAHYRNSSVSKDPSKQYQLNKQQATTNKCMCQIF